MAEKVTTDTIIDWLKLAVEQKVPVDAHTWLDAAQKLTVMIGDEHDILFGLQSTMAKKRVELLEQGFTVAKAKAYLEADPIYTLMQRQKARIGSIEEMVRIAKIQARMKDTEYRA